MLIHASFNTSILTSPLGFYVPFRYILIHRGNNSRERKKPLAETTKKPAEEAIRLPEAKINIQFSRVHSDLPDASNKQWFQESRKKSLRQKVAQVCPTLSAINPISIKKTIDNSVTMNAHHGESAMKFSPNSLSTVLSRKRM